MEEKFLNDRLNELRDKNMMYSYDRLTAAFCGTKNNINMLLVFQEVKLLRLWF